MGVIIDFLVAVRGTVAVALRRADPVGLVIVGVAGLLLAAGGVLMVNGLAGWIGGGPDRGPAAPSVGADPAAPSAAGPPAEDPGGGPLLDVLGLEPSADRPPADGRPVDGGARVADEVRAPATAPAAPAGSAPAGSTPAGPTPAASTPGTAGSPATTGPAQPDGTTTSTTAPEPAGGDVGGVLGDLLELLGLA